MFNEIGVMDKSLPPHIRFETRPVEDRSRSIEEGQKIYKDEDWVIITPRGGRDYTENTVDQWFKNITDRSHVGQYNPEWVKTFKNMYSLYKEGKEMPEEGTPLKMMVKLFSPAEIENCAAFKVHTLEALANANEETIGRIGMQGRELKNRAQEALKLNDGKGAALKIAALETDKEELKTRVRDLENVIRDLQAQINVDSPRRGRPPKE